MVCGAFLIPAPQGLQSYITHDNVADNLWTVSAATSLHRNSAAPLPFSGTATAVSGSADFLMKRPSALPLSPRRGEGRDCHVLATDASNIGSRYQL